MSEFITPASLLERLGDPKNPRSEQDWDRFVELYGPLVYRWATIRRLQPSDARDLVQEVFVALHDLLPRFRYDPNKKFRGYLFGITRNQISRLWKRRPRELQECQVGIPLAEVETDESDHLSEQDYNAYVSQKALDLIRNEFTEAQMNVFWMHVVQGVPAAGVAKNLGISRNVVYLTRSRVLARLRVELRHLLD